MEPQTPIIKVENLTVGYGDMVVLKDISFEVRRGTVLAILGGSGCGKSTLLKNLIGLAEPMAGKVYIHGSDFYACGKKEREALLKRIGVSFQNGALFGSMSVIENVMLPLEELTDLPPEACRMTAAMKLQLVGLSGFEHYRPSELSGGMQKRAALARAMALDPEILFLDEPSAGLDPITSAQLDDLILSLAHTLGITFVLVTHELESIFTLAGRAIMLDKKTQGIIADGHPDELRNKTDNLDVWCFFNRSICEPMKTYIDQNPNLEKRPTI